MLKGFARRMENRPAILLVCFAIGALAAILSRSPLFTLYENQLYDMQARLATGWGSPSSNIVVIAVDDYSLSALEDDLGRWPWVRATHGVLLEHCAQADAVAFDFLFPEKEFAARFDIDSDDLFATAVVDHGRVVSAAHFGKSGINVPATNTFKRFALNDSLTAFEVPAYPSVLMPYDQLLAASHGVGHVNVTYDGVGEGTMRRYGLMAQHGDKVFPSLALSTVVTARGLSGDEIELDANQNVLIGDQPFPILKNGSYHYRAHRQISNNPDEQPFAYTYYSYADILKAALGKENAPDIPPEVFAGKIVLVGSLATGMADDRIATPTDATLPGVMLHATVIDNLLHGDFFRRSASTWSVILALVLGVIPALPRIRRPLGIFAMLVAVYLLYLVAMFISLRVFAYVLPGSAPLAALIGASFYTGLIKWNIDRRRRSELEQIDKAKQQFTDMLVHDLRGRIATLSTSVELLGSMKIDPDHLTENRVYQTIVTSNKRLLREVSTLLDIRKIEEGGMPLRRVQSDLNLVVHQSVVEFQTAAELIGIELSEALDDELNTPVYFDPDILERILGNLIWNAIQYGKKKTKIIVSTNLHRDRVQISVANRGRTISEEAQKTIFLPFISGDEGPRNTQNTSTGLGLTFCRLATEAHGGNIHLESPWAAQGDGVCITIEFPQKQAKIDK